MSCLFFFNDTATTEIYTLSLHDALPISTVKSRGFSLHFCARFGGFPMPICATGYVCGPHWPWHAVYRMPRDRKSTRLNSSHTVISYAVFCLKKKITHQQDTPQHLAAQVC